MMIFVFQKEPSDVKHQMRSPYTHRNITRNTKNNGEGVKLKALTSIRRLAKKLTCNKIING